MIETMTKTDQHFDCRLNRWEPVRYPWETPRDFMAEYDEILARWGYKSGN